MDPDFYIKETAFYDNDFEKKCDEWGDKEICDEWISDFFENDFVKQETINPFQSNQLDADQMGLAMAFGEFAAIGEKVYDIDESTDEENWNNAMNLCSLQDRQNSVNEQKLAMFEQYIKDITSKKCKGPWSEEP